MLVLIVGIAWLGTRENGTRPEIPVVGIAVVVANPPAVAKVGAPTTMRWLVRAPVGSTTTHTSIHWGTVSRAEALGTDVSPTQSGYPNLLPDYAAGTFALPREFAAALVLPETGTYFYRAHAIIGGQHIWSPEYAVRVE